MQEQEIFRSVPLEHLVNYFDDEMSADHTEFPSAQALPDGVQVTSSPYFDEDQMGVGACVPHAIGTAVEMQLDEIKKQIPGTEHISRMFPYALRSNHGQPGSSPYEMVSIFEKVGWIPYTELPNVKTEAEADAIVISREMFDDAYVNAKDYNVKAIPVTRTEEALINAVQSGAKVAFTFCSSIREWRQEYIDLIETNFDPNTAAVAHEQFIIPGSAFIKDGKTYFTTAESAHIAGLNHHHFSWDFLNERMYNPMIIPVTVATHNYPIHQFETNLKQGMSGDEVKLLQWVLVEAGFLEEKYKTGNFRVITFNAVRQFQKANGIPATGFVGALTRAKLNELCKA